MGSVYAAVMDKYCRRVLSYKPNFAIAPNALFIVQTRKRETPKGLSEIVVTTFSYSPVAAVAAVKVYLPKS